MTKGPRADKTSAHFIHHASAVPPSPRSSSLLSLCLSALFFTLSSTLPWFCLTVTLQFFLHRFPSAAIALRSLSPRKSPPHAATGDRSHPSYAYSYPYS